MNEWVNPDLGACPETVRMVERWIYYSDDREVNFPLARLNTETTVVANIHENPVSPN